MSFLSSHNYGYQVSWCNLLTSIITGASGIPYAKRHYELSKVNENRVAHRVFALIEYMPIIGGAVAIVERIAYALFGSDSMPWKNCGINSKEALEKMIKNQKKAMSEHYNQGSYLRNPYLSSMTLSATNLQRKESEKLKLSHYFADAQGPRPTMEDAHFYMEMEKGALVGVFDGHGGSKVSAYAGDQFQKRFPQALKKANGNVREAFEVVIHQIHQKVANTSGWNNVGSTAVVSYINYETHQIFTATLGDSEANIYRKVGWGSLVSIPLSCIRDWLSKKDLRRLIDIYGIQAVGHRIQDVRGDAKCVRSCLDQGVNVARAIGDVANTGELVKPLVIHKPKITVNQLKAGDTLVLACDGLKDFVPEKEIVSIIGSQSTTEEQSKSLAQRLVDSALKRMDSRANDNVTVVVIEVA